MENPAQGGAPNSQAGRSDASEYTPPITNTQHVGTAIAAALAGQRFERQVERLHRLGPRPLAEMLAEIAAATGQHVRVVDLVEEYAQLDPAVLRFLGGNHFPPNVLGVVR